MNCGVIKVCPKAAASAHLSNFVRRLLSGGVWPERWGVHEALLVKAVSSYTFVTRQVVRPHAICHWYEGWRGFWQWFWAVCWILQCKETQCESLWKRWREADVILMADSILFMGSQDNFDHNYSWYKSQTDNLIFTTILLIWILKNKTYSWEKQECSKTLL